MCLCAGHTKECMVYLQKAFGSALSGSPEYEQFYIIFGKATRNGKTSLIDTVARIFGDYAVTAQPQTLSRRSSNGAAPSPDLARLHGARFISIPEPEKDMPLNSALIKQFTGGDTFVGRFLSENPFEFKVLGKIFYNTNHLPPIKDDTILTSGRVKVIPFNRHFNEDEQDKGLKQLFQHKGIKSAVLNWLLKGYEEIQKNGFDTPPRIEEATAEYHSTTIIVKKFLNENTRVETNSVIKTSKLYEQYTIWAINNDFPTMKNTDFVQALRELCDVRRHNNGRVVKGLTVLDIDELFA